MQDVHISCHNIETGERWLQTHSTTADDHDLAVAQGALDCLVIEQRWEVIAAEVVATSECGEMDEPFMTRGR